MTKRSKKSLQRLLSLFMSVLIVLSLFSPSVGHAADNSVSDVELEKVREAAYLAEQEESLNGGSSEISTLLSGLDWNPEIEGIENPQQEKSPEKVEGVINEALKKETKVDVIIKLKDVADYGVLQQNAMLKKSKAERGAYVKGQLEATAKESQKGLKKALALMEKAGSVKVKQSFWINNSIAATVDKAALAELEARPDIERIYLDKVIQLPEVMEESSKPRLPEWGLEKIKAPKVWGDYGIKGEGIVVGIMDTGADGKHEALKDNYRGRNGEHQYSWIDFSSKKYATPNDGHGHGTHVAGTAVGGGSGEPIGVAPGAEWIAAKIFDDGGGTTTSTIHAAFEWFIAPGGDPSKAPHVVNNSWGNSNPYSTEFYADVKAWIAAGIFPLFAAGNDGPGGQTIGSPGSFPESFAIGATDSYDQIASFSSRGPVFWVNENGERVRYIKPDVSAPGHQIYSAWPTQLGKGKYNTISGTSMATPHVAGAIALLLSANPNMSIGEVSELLKNTARTEPHMGSLPNDLYGTGIVNIYQAVTEAAFAGVLNGKITDSAGKPVKAEIELVGENIRFSTDDNGLFKQNIRAGSYNVKIRAFGYQELTSQAKIVKDQTTSVNWKLESAIVFSVKGEVLDKNSSTPIPYAYVRLKGTPLKTIRTDHNGKFHFANIPVGVYELQVTGERIKGQTVKVNLQSDQNLKIEVSQTGALGNKDWNTANNNYARNAVSPAGIDTDYLELGWNFETGTMGNILYSTPAVSGHQIIAVTDLGWIISLNTKTGEEIWSVRLGSTNRSSPTVENGMVYVSGGADGTIYALDLKNGNIQWSRNLGQSTIYESPLYKNGTVFVGSGLNGNPSLFALDAKTGAILWTKALGADSYFGGTLGDEYLYIGTYQNRTIQAINPANGAEVWKRQVDGLGFSSKPVFHDGVVYATAVNFDAETGTLFAFDADSGEVFWSVAGIGDVQAASPIIYENLVITSSASKPILQAFDRTNGHKVWENRSVGPSSNNGAVSSNGVLFVAGTGGYFYALDVYSGEVVKDFALPDYSTSGIPVVAGKVFVPHRKGIQAFVANGIIQGAMTDKNGKSLSGKITVVETGEEATVDDEGKFTLTHQPGQYTVKASFYGKKQVTTNIEFVSGYTVEHDFQLEDASEGSLQLTVLDKRTKQHLQDVVIELTGTPISGSTDSEGVYSNEAVFEGEYVLSLTLSGYDSPTPTITIEAGKQNAISVELQPFDIAVLDDWGGEVTALLNRNGFAAQQRGWDIIDDIGSYKIIYLNGAYTSTGVPPTKEKFEQFLQAAKDHNVHLIFADAWGGSYGTIEHLYKYLGDPAEFGSHVSGSGFISMKVDVKHPIFNGFENNERIMLYSRTGDFIWFNKYSGRHLGTIGSSTIGDKGTGVAYKPVTENSAHLLLAAHAASPWISPMQGWSQDMQKILFNSVSYLENVKFATVAGSVTDTNGEPLKATVEIVETGTDVQTTAEANAFELFHDEGEFTLEVRSPGFTTVQVPVTLVNGVPVTQEIILSSTEGGTVSGTLTDATTGNQLPGATVKLNQAGEVIAEVVVGNNGHYEFLNVNEDNYIVQAQAQGYLVEEQEVRVRGEAVVADFSLNPIPKVAVLYDYTTASKSFASVMAERGIPVTSLNASNVVERIAEFDVLYVNEMSTINVPKAKFNAMMAAADAAGTSVIFSDSYYTDSPIQQLSAYRGDPIFRDRAKVTNTPAGYVVDEEHPIFGGSNVGDYIELMSGSYSSIGYFSGYSGYPIASIKHTGREAYGTGVAYKPRTSNSVELLMAGHAFNLAHDATHYTKEGKEIMVRAILWAAQASFPTLSGTVTDEQGNPIESAVKVVGKKFDTKSDVETGDFEIAILAGDYELEISAYGYQTAVIPAKAAFNMDKIEVKLLPDEAASSISGMVQNEKDGNAIEGVEVQIDGFPRSAVTNLQGSFEIDLVSPGTYTLTLTKEGYVFKEIEVVVNAKDNKKLAITMKPSPTVGIIVDNTANAFTLASYLQGRGYKTIDMFYTDLDKLKSVDLVIANSDYNNNLIPSKEVFAAFQKALDASETSIIWTGHSNGRGAIRFLTDYDKNPAVEARSTKVGIKGKVTESHPIVAGIKVDELFDMKSKSNEYYYFDGYDGTTIAQLEHMVDGRLGGLVGYKGRTANSVEVLLASMTFSSNFNQSLGEAFDPYRERIVNNAITWILDNGEALVGELHGKVTNNLNLPVHAEVKVVETGKKIQTENDGKFYLGLPEGAYTLEVKAFGHLDKQFPIEVTTGQRTEVELVIDAETAGTITGSVLDGISEQAIKGATVTVLGTPLYTLTDETGKYEMAIPAGNYELRVTAKGYSARVEPVEIGVGEASEKTFLLSASEKIAFLGILSNANRVLPFLADEGYQIDFVDYREWTALQNNMKDYSVIIFNNKSSTMSNDSFRSFVEQADEDQVSIIFNSQYSGGTIGDLVKVYGDPKSSSFNYVPRAINVKVLHQHPLFAGISGDEFTILDKGKDSLNQQYAVFSGYSGTTLAQITHTDRGVLGDGIGYSFSSANSVHLLLGSMEVGAYSIPNENWTPEAKMLYTNAIDWAMSASIGEIRGVVKNAKGEPVANADVSVPTIAQAVKTNARGEFRVGAGTGRYDVKVTAKGYFEQIKSTEITHQGEVVELNFELEAIEGTSIAGKVVDKRTNKEIVGAKVVLKAEGDSKALDEFVTNETGDFLFEQLLPGNYELAIEAKGFLSAVHEVIVGEDQAKVTIEMDAIGVAVIGDWNNTLTTFLNDNDLFAEATEWSVIDQLKNFKLIIVNTDKGTTEQIQQLIGMADKYNISVVFLGTWGSAGSIGLLEKAVGYPQLATHGYNEGAVEVTSLAGHPIFESLPETFVIHTEGSPYSTFDFYPGNILANIAVDGQDKGAAIAYEFRTRESVHMLLSSFAVTNMSGPGRGWTKEGETLFIQSLKFAIDAKEEAKVPDAPTWDQDSITTSDKPVIITGRATPFSVVYVYDTQGFKQTLLGSTEANGNGRFSFELSLGEGSYILVARSMSTVGRSGYSGKLQLVVE